MKKVIFSLLTMSFMGMVALPTLADQANVQNSTQVVTQDGAYNSSIQTVDQEIRSKTNRRGYDYYGNDSDNIGNVQGAVQDTAQRGLGNRNDQAVRQRVEVRKEYQDRFGW